MTRARVFAGPAHLRQKIQNIVRKTLTCHRDPNRLVADVASMRERLAKEHAVASIWDIKYLRGGLIDIEFIAQYLMLRHAAATPSLLRANTAEALEELNKAGYLDENTFKLLSDTLGLWQRLQSTLRLTCCGAFNEDKASAGQRNLLVRAGMVDNFEDLKRTIRNSADDVHTCFDELITAPAMPIRAAQKGNARKK